MNGDELKETAADKYSTENRELPYSTLAEELYRKRVIQAREMPLEEKILAGQRLFEAACEITLAGIRDQHPGQTEEYNREILRERLAWRRKREANQ